MYPFYSKVAVVPAGDQRGITLDGKPLNTPGRCALRLPTHALANAVADEWRAQGAKIDFATMPMTALANAATDLIAPDSAAFAASLAAYGESDLLYYRAPEADLAAEQARQWNPILDWAEAQWNVEFTLAEGVIFVAQSPESCAALSAHVHALPPFQLAALSPLVTIGGSLIIALALIERAFQPSALWQALTLDECWQEERWGAVDDAVEARGHKEAEWMAAARFLTLL